MLFRFSLYGFLKNQRYFEPFIMLAFLSKGLDFFQIGLLFGCRELLTHLLELPTGAVADVMGRRRAMIVSHVAYLACFCVLGWADTMGVLLAAMGLFAVGEAFRTGTHKAIIFTWLTHEGRADEKTHIYGYTRSWSKLGSALSALIAGGLLLCWSNYDAIFYLSAIPMALNLVNFCCYPAYLDDVNSDVRPGLRAVARTFWAGVKNCFHMRSVRRLIAQSMCFEGVYKSCKDYIQPILQTMAISLPILLRTSDARRATILVAVIYALLAVGGSIASRRAGRFVAAVGGPVRARRILWLGFTACFALVLVGVLTGSLIWAVAGMVVLSILENLWRPTLISAIADRANKSHLATVLSVESQTKTLFAAVAAPLLGWSIDAMHNTSYPFLPVAVLGLAAGGVCLFLTRKK